MRISRLTVSNYKSFQSFVLPIRHDTFLVGPNNAGKSTLIEAIRVCAGMARVASRLRPNVVCSVGGRPHWSYPINSDSLGLVTENLRYRFQGHEARLRLAFDNGVRINGVWPALDEYGEPYEKPFFYVEKKEDEGFSSARPATLKLPGTIGILPTLSPIPDREEVLDREYVERYSGTPRTSNHLRNLIYHIQQDGEFNDFRGWVLNELTELDDLSIRTRPGESYGRSELDVFFRENSDHTDREICWAGDGIQIYLQILVHLWRYSSASIVVLDEPDVFLHADLQRRLVRLLERQTYQTITATHSVEMLAEASEDAVVWVDKSRRKAVTRPAPGGYDDLSNQIGSHFNLRLASALKAKVVVFVEGKDMSILRRVAETIGASELSTETRCAVIPMQGYTNWEHIEPFQWFMRKFLYDSVNVFVILDRDYRTDSEVAKVKSKLSGSGVTCHVWKRKELESYLIEVGPLARLSGLTRSVVDQLLDSAAAEVLNSCEGQFLTEFQKTEVPGHVAPGTSLQRALAHFKPRFEDSTWLRQRLPAKDVISAFNRLAQDMGADPVSPQKLAREIRENEVVSEMKNVLLRVQSNVLRGGV